MPLVPASTRLRSGDHRMVATLGNLVRVRSAAPAAAVTTAAAAAAAAVFFLLLFLRGRLSLTCLLALGRLLGLLGCLFDCLLLLLLLFLTSLRLLLFASSTLASPTLTFHTPISELEPRVALFEFAAFLNDHRKAGGVPSVPRHSLDLPHHLHAAHHLSKHGVLAVEKGGRLEGNEELRAVGAGARISHRECTRRGVEQGEILVRELAAVDGLAAGAVLLGEVTALDAEARHHTMHRTPAVVQRRAGGPPCALLARAQCAEVL
mmetsp:Transcript_19972/g.32380  ORF Transcript_19972/g.32380 Transcript_19972/m.32380 type:complete len:263 (+) Transcript_19972:304-1092(+)